jgi:hypothetical protein
MILFLRNSKNESIVDIELFEKGDYIELRSVICIQPYSELLLSEFVNNPIGVDEMIKTFDELSELRGWLWEVYFMGEQNTASEFENVLKEVQTRLKGVAKKYNLNFITD